MENEWFCGKCDQNIWIDPCDCEEPLAVHRPSAPAAVPVAARALSGPSVERPLLKRTRPLRVTEPREGATVLE
jgi:hypothetical protein